MQYSEYGRTGRRVSAIGFGGMRFDTSRPKEENAELVRYACSRGINYFDTAPGYRDSEEIFGLAFRDMPGEFIVSTKAMPTSCPTPETLRTSLMRSLDRMGVPKIDFFHVWCLRKMEHYELAIRPGGMYHELLKCRDEGLIDHIVVSTHQPGDQVRTILESDRFEGVLMGVNMLNFPYRWDGVMAAAERGLGVVAMNPLSGGVIPEHEERLAFLAGPGETPTEAALRFLVACPQITVALVGFTTREHVDLACRVAEDAPEPMTDERLDAVRAHLGKNMTALCTGCGYCTGCPQDIAVATYMQHYNQKLLMDQTSEQMKESMATELEWQLVAARRTPAAECTECGQCEEKCTQHLDIISRLKEIAEWEKSA